MAAQHRKRTRKHLPIVVPKRGSVVLPPGTIEPPAGAAAPALRALVYGPEACEEFTPRSLDEALALRPAGSGVLWLAVEGIGDADLFRALGERFRFHPLALEDAVNQHQRPKVEEYGDHVFITVQTPIEEEGTKLAQMSLFVGADYVVTVHDRANPRLEGVRQRIQAGRGRIRRLGADYLAYALLDAAVDSFFPTVEAKNSRLATIEQQIFAASGEDVIAELHDLRHDLHILRRVLATTREAVGQLARGETGAVSEEARTFFRDCQDHTSQLLDALDSCRDLSTGLMELHVGNVSNRTNDVMKVLTIIATVFIPLSFIAGIYGMNFDPEVSRWNMPELGWYLGYPFALLVMLGTAAGLVAFLWTRGWIGRR